MNILSELYNNKSAYFLSIKDEKTICCGGTNGGRFYGIIEIQISPDHVSIHKIVSDGVSSSMILNPESYSLATEEYKLGVKLLKTIKDYLANAHNRIYQDESRGALMANTQKLLSQYEN